MKPKRDRSRWLEAAPEYVTACRDAGEKVGDRWTVFIGGSLAMDQDPASVASYGRREEYLGMNNAPTHPSYGISQWGETQQGHRSGAGKTIRWLDLPLHIREHVMNRCEPGRHKATQAGHGARITEHYKKPSR